MTSKLNALLEKRLRLQAQADGYRDDMSSQALRWQQRLHVLDRVILGVNFLRRHPTVLIASAGLLAFIKPIKLARFALGAWASLQSVKRVRAWFSHET